MTLGWQELIVAFLIIFCLIRVIYGIYIFFHRAKNDENPCANCVSGCELKRQLDKKKQECGKNQKDSNKNCCR